MTASSGDGPKRPPGAESRPPPPLPRPTTPTSVSPPPLSRPPRILTPSRPFVPPSRNPSQPPPRMASTPPPASTRAPAPSHSSLRPGSRPPPPRRQSSGAALRLSTIDYDLANAARRVIASSLGVVLGEVVVLIVDVARRDIGAALFEVARDIGAEPIVHELEMHGERPLKELPPPLRAALERAQASVMVVGFDDNEVPMRLELLEEVRRLGLRHAHMVGVSRRSLITGFAVEHARILDSTRAVRTRLRPDSTLRLRTTAGSDLEVKLDPAMRWVEYVGVIRPGRWENLPAGKLVTCPATVRGVFVADGSIGGKFGEAAGLLDKTPVRIEIEASFCKGVRCTDRALQREVETFLQREHNLQRVGSVTLGTNVGILGPTGELVSDQNLPGLHVSFGSTLANTGATWSTRGQLPMTAANADIDLDGMPLMRSGRYMVS